MPQSAHWQLALDRPRPPDAFVYSSSACQSPHAPAYSDILISLYRMYEWVLAFALVLALYTRTPADRRTELMAHLIGRVAWIWIAMTYIVLPFMSSQVYGGAGDGEMTSAHAQLGGEFLSPSYLATLSVAAFFYALFSSLAASSNFAGASSPL
ncbi:hypothetical protein [Tunturiibacter gelidiferens]|uniref:hypothetical protein n=1 Tax=Tunturiibacter gelidiferens TaxID=3069689 RepID=UPI003D9B96DA